MRRPRGRFTRLHLGHSSGALIGVLTLLLGFAIAVQVHATSGTDSLAALRDDDLVDVLDNQDARAERLRQQLAELQQQSAQLQDSGNRSAAARRQIAQQSADLAVLLGTVPVSGPGVDVAVSDPARALDGEDLLDVVEELRGAGAEAIEVAGRRIGTDSWFAGPGGAVVLDGAALRAPYRVRAIGAARTLDTALNIPGGIAAVVRAAGGTLAVREQPSVVITATRPLPGDRYARPVH